MTEKEREAGTAMVHADASPVVVPPPEPDYTSKALAATPREQAQLMKDAAAALMEITSWAIAMTDRKDWDNMSGKPRLNKLGAQKVAKLTGLRVETFGSRMVESGVDDEGPWYRYECNGRVSSPWSPSVIHCQGSCDSRSQFHSTRYKGSGNSRERYRLNASQVNRSNIAQQAQTNCRVRGVTEYLGLERLDWKDVEQHTQARQEHATSVDFDGRPANDRKPAPATQPPPERDDTDLANADERTAVWQAYCKAKDLDQSSPPAGEATRFYDWIERVTGDPRWRDRDQWTVGVALALRKAAQRKQHLAATATPADGPADPDGAPQDEPPPPDDTDFAGE